MARRKRHGRERAHARRQGGVAMLEALIVIGLLVVCMQCLWWTARYCTARHRSIIAARAIAWQEALAGCKHPPLEGVADGLSRASGEVVDEVAGVDSETGDAPDWLAVTPGDGASVRIALGAQGIGPGEVKATRRFACNEPGSERALDLRDLGQTAGLIGDVLSAAL